MTLYYRTTDARILDLDPVLVASLAPSKRDTLKLYSVDPQPAPSSTQYVVSSGVVIDAASARQTWALADKSPEQIAAETFAASQSATLEQARLVYAAMKNGAGTAAERLARLERVCAYYLRETFGGEPA